MCPGPKRPTIAETAAAYPRRSAHLVGEPIAHIYKGRLNNFVSPGQYESENLLSMLDKGRASDGEHVKLHVHDVPDLARPNFKEVMADQTAFKPTNKGQKFGPSWSTHWFRFHLKVPQVLLKEERLEFHWDAGNEGLIWTVNGIPL